MGFVFNHFALLMGWSLCFVPDHCHLPERRGGVFFVSHHSKQCWGPSGFDRGYSHPSQGRFHSPSSRLWCRAQSSLAQPAPVLEQRPWPCGHCSLFLQLCTCWGSTWSFNPQCRAEDWTRATVTQASAVGFSTYCNTAATPKKTILKCYHWNYMFRACLHNQKATKTEVEYLPTRAYSTNLRTSNIKHICKPRDMLWMFIVYQ